jgi:hypothetical protein
MLHTRVSRLLLIFCLHTSADQLDCSSQPSSESFGRPWLKFATQSPVQGALAGQAVQGACRTAC